jgi:GT2 family glycosyltransferase
MYRFSILIPSWNNLPYLKLCIRSIQQNSHFRNQIIVYVNEGKDNTVAWLKEQQDVDYIHSDVNVGICFALNECRSLIKAPYVVYMNDDMYVCPKWDLELNKAIESAGTKLFMFSSTLIEPHASANPQVVSIVKDFGDSLESFQEDKLLQDYQGLKKEDWYGSSWPPSVISTHVWDAVGGYSIEFSPGMYSDPDFSMKLWKYGVRLFKGIGASKVYHFQSKSTGRSKKNKGSDTFLLKWGMSARSFYKYYLHMGKPFDKPPGEAIHFPSSEKFRNKLKRSFKALFTTF